MEQLNYYQNPRFYYRDLAGPLLPLKLEDADDDETEWIDELKKEQELEPATEKAQVRERASHRH